jgi:dTDP-4-dehydrorhamnose reductase
VGIEESELNWFLENSCPPDVMGFNYYLTSERYLDENIGSYPGVPVGGNGRKRYVDVEAVRVNFRQRSGLRVLLREAWNRYKIPIAITEVHLGCTREEQLRWFSEVWKTANDLRREAVDLRAVTAWSLLGSYDWNSLLTLEQNHYEPGVFDIRGGNPRPTALAHLLKKYLKNKDIIIRLRKASDGGNALPAFSTKQTSPWNRSQTGNIAEKLLNHGEHQPKNC